MKDGSAAMAGACLIEWVHLQETEDGLRQSSLRVLQRLLVGKADSVWGKWQVVSVAPRQPPEEVPLLVKVLAWHRRDINVVSLRIPEMHAPKEGNDAVVEGQKQQK